MKRSDLLFILNPPAGDTAETMSTDTLEQRLAALEQHVAAMSAGLGDAMRTMGDAFKAMAGGFTTYGVRVVDSEGVLIATLGPGGDGGGELVLHHPETGRQLAFRPVAP